ncbi:MAG: hypothetical protein DRH10_10480 [Deltaproteobacteria bacterium]|nr:MAG: hypothetical protein DRH10_10480 [Deltaproteobacteria bacterium]HDJ24250.1 Hpt domain-containing protein [Candidatus Aminicenantes bacterium]
MAKNHQKNPQALFDLDSALERTGGDKDFLRELLSIYEEEFESKVAGIKNAWQNKDFQTVQEISHSLKGASGNLSLISLEKLFLDLEQASKVKDEKKLSQIIATLDEEYSQVKNYLQEQHLL